MDGTTLKIHEMFISTFLSDKADRMRFFKKYFLFVNISPNIVLEILFLTINNIHIDFQT